MIDLSTQVALLEQLGAAPVEPLVDALRALHAGSPGGAEHLRRLLAPDSRALPQPEHDTRAAAAPVVDMPRDADYEAARRHFVEHGRRLREQALLAERLLDGFVRHQSETRPLQHELRLTATRGSSAGGSFVVVNTDETPTDVRFLVRATARADGVAAVEQSISFDPASMRLQPGEESVVRLSLSLRDYREQRDVLEMSVDVCSDVRLLVRLWICVRVTEQEALDDESRG